MHNELIVFPVRVMVDAILNFDVESFDLEGRDYMMLESEVEKAVSKYC